MTQLRTINRSNAYLGILAKMEADREAKAKADALAAEIDQMLLEAFPAYVDCAVAHGARETRYVQDLHTVRITYKRSRAPVMIRFSY